MALETGESSRDNVVKGALIVGAGAGAALILVALTPKVIRGLRSLFTSEEEKSYVTRGTDAARIHGRVGVNIGTSPPAVIRKQLPETKEEGRSPDASGRVHYPCDTAARPACEWNPYATYYPTLGHMSGPGEDNYTINDLAQYLYEAGKCYFAYDAHITSLNSFKDVLSVCEFPHKFYHDIRSYFNGRGADHLSRLLETDAEVQAILQARRDPDVGRQERTTSGQRVKSSRPSRGHSSATHCNSSDSVSDGRARSFKADGWSTYLSRETTPT